MCLRIVLEQPYLAAQYRGTAACRYTSVPGSNFQALATMFMRFILTKMFHLKRFTYGMYYCDPGIPLRRLGLQIRYWDSRTGHDQELLSDPKLLSLSQRQFDCVVTPNGMTISEFLKTMVQGREDPFFAVDLGRVLRLNKQWKMLLPGVDAFYGEVQVIFYIE